MSVTSFPGIILFLVLGRFLIPEVRRLFRAVLLRLVPVPASSLSSLEGEHSLRETPWLMILTGDCFRGRSYFQGSTVTETTEFRPGLDWPCWKCTRLPSDPIAQCFEICVLSLPPLISVFPFGSCFLPYIGLF